MKNQSFTLHQYCALAAGVLGASAMQAQTEYHEFDPYFPMTYNEHVSIDVDFDGEDDFEFHFRKEWSASTGYDVPDYSFSMQPLGANEVVITPLPADYSASVYSATCYFPAVDGVKELLGLSPVDADQDWGMATVMARGQECTYYALLEQGDWAFSGGQRDRYVGFRLSKPELYYGWLRIRHNDSGNIDYIKDVLIATEPDAGVITPNLIDVYAPGIGAVDIYYDAGTLKVAFDAVPDESLIGDYRIFLRNAIYVSALYGHDVDVIKEGNFVVVEKTGAASYVADISSLTKYWTDVPIESGEMMRAYVTTKYSYPHNMFNGLSPASAEIESTAPTTGVSFIDEAANVQAWYGNGMITIQSSDNNPTSIQVVNMNGQVIYSDMQLVNMLGSNLQIPFTAPSGMYIAHVMNSTGVLGSAMFIVQ